MSHNSAYAEAPSFVLDREQLRHFCREVLEIDGELRSLGDTKDTQTLQHFSDEFAASFSDLIPEINARISDKMCGIAAVDVPPIYDDLTDDAIAGALVSVALTTVLMEPSKDVENHTPFTMFSASYESNKALNDAGLLHISPTDILDFHSDGRIHGKTLGVPRYISIYNTFINYRNCGNFYWVPASSIDNLQEHVEGIGFDDDFTFDLTPAIYGESGSKIGSVVERKVKTAIFSEDEDGSIITFMNGKFAGKENADDDYTARLKAFQAAIARNPFRYAAEQKSRRMIVLNNSSGFHARDIFQDPILGHEETRNYLRSVSTDAAKTGYVIQ
ncbi:MULTISPECIES: hypothetical protein [Agrobacterium]|uniref:Uncharacterized protein n=1 Tax=Agrobacterium tumefaciens TaxID=358 RepID=A0AAJ4N3P6_AGRTU|nr:MULTISPECIES: hypothetical protein [Agrobacterium]MBO9111737.1 hypothetical protein [Agrobacterium sp. S2/73]NTA18867.1 hypothetical protein [Agrobacterium tumefaciens]QTG14528.1 hypothetical protein G6M86_14410 [Agrobacterium tumefaciens]QXZ75655.1 hypothetical protein J5276_24445 [Agrobacterium sp. S7/73]WCK74166.1 hypothetical protein G6L96_023950 [Agrobacterium tumefaciens]